MNEKLKISINKEIISTAIYAIILLLSVSFILELKSNRVEKDYKYN
jgi:hypothetical protein